MEEIQEIIFNRGCYGLTNRTPFLEYREIGFCAFGKEPVQLLGMISIRVLNFLKIIDFGKK